MTIQDLSRKYAGEDGELVLKDRPTILAYLEELAQAAEEVRLAVQGHPALPARIKEVDEAGSRLGLSLGKPLPVSWIRRKACALLFTLDGIRFLAPLHFLKGGAYLEAFFSLPETVRHADRRSRMRVHFGPREKATVTVLEGLLGARGATGPLLDLSLEGLRLRLDRALTIRGKAPLAVEEGTFPPGARFPILRIDQLPYSPVVVCAGVVAHVSRAEDGVHLGIRFEDLGETEAQIIRQVLGRRLPKFNQGFPERRRDGGAHTPAPKVTVSREGPVRPADVRPADTRKAHKRLLLIEGDDLERAILTSALRQDGYQRIHEARTCAEALDHAKVFPMDAVLLEDRVGPLDAAEILSRLRRHCEAAPSVLLAAALDVRTRALARAAQIDHVHPKAEDFEGELKEVLEGLLGL